VFLYAKIVFSRLSGQGRSSSCSRLVLSTFHADAQGSCSQRPAPSTTLIRKDLRYTIVVPEFVLEQLLLSSLYPASPQKDA
jgi:hypothetical protein